MPGAPDAPPAWRAAHQRKHDWPIKNPGQIDSVPSSGTVGGTPMSSEPLNIPWSLSYLPMNGCPIPYVPVLIPNYDACTVFHTVATHVLLDQNHSFALGTAVSGERDLGLSFSSNDLLTSSRCKHVGLAFPSGSTSVPALVQAQLPGTHNWFCCSRVTWVKKLKMY